MDALVESLFKSDLDDEQEPTRSAHASDASDDESNEATPRNNIIEAPPPHGGPQTGPKGVLADHRYHKQQTQQQKTAAIIAHNERMMSKAFTTTTYREDQEMKAQEEELLRDLENCSDEEEKQILKKYRYQRLEEIKGTTTTNNKSLKKRFGSLKEISANQYVKAIDNEAQNVCVIIHLYDNSNPQCRLLNECLIHLARKFVGAKFLRILAHDLEFDPIGLPALLVYKNGELIANLVKITEEIGETDFDSDTVEEVLIRYGAINVNEDIDDLNDDDDLEG